jgi:hypothetical protein
VAARRKPATRAAALPARNGLPDIGAYLPSSRSVLLGAALLALALASYLAARDTSLFAVRSLDVRGGTPAVRAQVRAALAPELGRSLMRVDNGELADLLAGVAGVRSFTYDRNFPHTLKVTVRPERAVLVARQGAEAYLLSSSGRVLRKLSNPRSSALPRLYVKHDVLLTTGRRLGGMVAAAAFVVAPVGGASLPGRVAVVKVAPHDARLVLARGLELRLGDPTDVRLKLAIAREILRADAAAVRASGYLDVSLPERPVLYLNSQVAS